MERTFNNQCLSFQAVMIGLRITINKTPVTNFRLLYIDLQITALLSFPHLRALSASPKRLVSQKASTIFQSVLFIVLVFPSCHDSNLSIRRCTFKRSQVSYF